MNRAVYAVLPLLLLTGCSDKPTSSPSSTAAVHPTSGGNLPIQGALPAPGNRYFAAPQCNTTQVTLVASGELVIRKLTPTTNWTVEYDNSQGQMIGSVHSGAFTGGKQTVVDDYADDRNDLKYAQITLTGKTAGSCVVIKSE